MKDSDKHLVKYTGHTESELPQPLITYRAIDLLMTHYWKGFPSFSFSMGSISSCREMEEWLVNNLITCDKVTLDFTTSPKGLTVHFKSREGLKYLEYGECPNLKNDYKTIKLNNE